MGAEINKVVDKENKISWREVIEEENRFIRARREKKKPIDIDTQESEPKDLVGLAISGGGIRSASFALGVFEALKQKGLFKKIDYLSTVSGGGYIGAWLSANCHRNKDWLEKEKEKENEGEEGMQWKKSIAHLRRFSNYLSPKLGLLSADTWSMVTVWLRNTLLIQIMILLSIAVLLLGTKGLFHFFAYDLNEYLIYIRLLTFICLFYSSYYITRCLRNLNHNRSDALHSLRDGQKAVQKVVMILISGIFLLSVLFWLLISEHTNQNYSFWDSIALDFGALLLWVYVSSASFAYFSIVNCTSEIKKIRGALAASIIPTIASFLLFAAMIYVVADWKAGCAVDEKCNYVEFLAFVSMPTALLGTFAFASVLLIGMLGRASSDYFREWWSRFGAWLAIYGFIWMVFVSAIFIGAWLTDRYSSGVLWQDITAFGVWFGTILTGLFAGKSVDTNGKNQKGISTKFKEMIAKVAPAVFILGLLIAISVLLHNIFAALSNTSKDFESLIVVGNCIYIVSAIAICFIGMKIFSWRIDINEFSLNAFYRHRLARCFLGASRQPEKRNPHPFTGFDAHDDLKLADLLQNNEVPRGPLHIINCSLNLGGSSDLSLHTRHSSNFILTPLYCGSSYPVKNPNGTEIGPVGYVKTNIYGGEETQPTLGQSISVSGAAASPNSGYHTSSSVSFLMTLFNARLGWWFPNPSKSECNVPSPKFSLKYILDELFGSANAESKFLSISDGGHFENLAAYELIRRRCKVIIISDGECDPELQLEGLAALIRMCEVDGLAKIKIDTRAICSLNESNWSNSRWAVGKITYPNNAADDKKNNAADDKKNDAADDKDDDKNTGYLIYLKASMNGHENTPVLQYKVTHPDFPHESTGDQFYSENQFESYRGLGKDITEGLFGKIKDIESESMTMTKVAEDLYSINAPQLVNEKQFIRNADQLMAIWRQLGADNNLEKLAEELRPQTNKVDHSTFYMCSEIIQLMENVYLDMNLEDTWNHPDNEGWKKLFIEWAKTPTLNKVWKQTQKTYGERFIYFWERNLK